MADSEARYQTIFDNTPIALWETDFTELFEALDELKAQGVADFRSYFDEHPEMVVELARKATITDINQRTLQNLGLSSKAPLVGAPMDTVFYDESSYADFKEQLISIAGGKLTHESEGQMLSPEGDVIYIVVTVAVMKPGPDGRIRALASTLDITARRRAELALSATNQELKRSNQELEQFAYVASHDLQEPLRLIGSYADLIKSRYNDILDDRGNKFVAQVVDSAHRMQALIDDLLQLSRLGTSMPPMVPVDCDALVAEVMRNLEAARAEQGAEITRDELPTVKGNEMRLSRLFQNLISNAMKFRGDDPPRVHIGVERVDDEWVFSVADNGIGIPRDKRDAVFAIFKRLHGRGDYPGTGIGLAIAKKIVEQHNGRIWLESEVGAGTTFYFSIPAAGSSAQTPEAAVTATP